MSGAETVTVVIPSIPPRAELLNRALASVAAQTHPVAAVSIAYDIGHEGAWATRNRALQNVSTEWTAFLDDDDELYPHHVQYLLDLADAHKADFVWGWFDVVNPPGLRSSDPFPQHRGREYDPDNPHCIPITYMVKTEWLMWAVGNIGGFHADPGGSGAWEVQDAPLIAEIARLGARMKCTYQVTWKWWHHGDNTSGVPTRW
jgi:glycosyltransferase involved in cell wall biosynthesis